MRDWDRENEAANRAILIQQNRDRYLAQAHKFREQTEAIGFSIIAAAARTTIALNRVASQLTDLDKPIAEYTQREIDLLLSLPLPSERSRMLPLVAWIWLLTGWD